MRWLGLRLLRWLSRLNWLRLLRLVLIRICIFCFSLNLFFVLWLRIRWGLRFNLLSFLILISRLFCWRSFWVLIFNFCSWYFILIINNIVWWTCSFCWSKLRKFLLKISWQSLTRIYYYISLSGNYIPFSFNLISRACYNILLTFKSIIISFYSICISDYMIACACYCIIFSINLIIGAVVDKIILTIQNIGC